jgi:putative endonuclease
VGANVRSYWVYVLASKPRGTLYIGMTNLVREAIQREKTIKEWPRAWKLNLIERDNPHWVDLYPSLPGVRTPLIKSARG